MRAPLARGLLSWVLAVLGLRLRALLAVVVCCLLAACATTKPWQREALAQGAMAVDGDADAFALWQHMLGTREGAIGGFGGGGGGCGCN